MKLNETDRQTIRATLEAAIALIDDLDPDCLAARDIDDRLRVAHSLLSTVRELEQGK